MPVQPKKVRNGNGQTSATRSNGHGAAQEFDAMVMKAAVVDAAAAPIVALAPDHTIRYMNSAAAAMAGLRAQEGVGRKLWEFFESPECRNGTCALSTVLETRAACTHDGEFSIQGQTRTLRVASSPWFDDEGHVCGAVQVFTPLKEESQLATEVTRVTAAVRGGDTSARCDAQVFTGRYKSLVGQFNDVLDALEDKLNWYLSIVDAVPFPVHVIDKDMKWTFLNRAFEKLMVDQGYVKDRDEAVGMPCSTANANICNTQECGIRRLQRGFGDSFFDWCGMSCKQDTAWVLNAKGEKVGYVETVQDLTPSIRVKDYTNTAVAKLESNLVKLAQGDLALDVVNNEADTHTRDTKVQFDRISASMSAVKGALEALVSDANMLSQAAVEGRLATRAEATRHQGDYRKIVEGVNETLDAVIGPLNVAAGYVDGIAKGEIPEKISDNYNGDFNAIKNNLNSLIETFNGFVVAQREMSEKHGAGWIDEYIAADKFPGTYGQMARGINELVKSHIDVKMKIVDVVSRYALGDFTLDMDRLPGKKAKITEAIDGVKHSLQAVNAEIGALVTAAVDGKLSTRADADKFQYSFRDMVLGINRTLDAVIGPLNVAAGYVDRISKGDIPAKISDNYNGDFNAIKNNLNQCIDAVNALVADANTLSQAAVEGRLATRADATRHQGDFRKIVEGVNDTLDAVIGPLNVAAGYVDRISKGDIPAKISDNYNGDFNAIKNNLNQCIDAVNALVADANMLSKAAVDGHLATRADVAPHQGDFRKIVAGVNATLDAVVAPIQEVEHVLGQLANGDFTVEINKQYAGEFEELRKALNAMVRQVRTALIQIGSETVTLASASEQLGRVSDQMGASADETAKQATMVSAASEQVSTNIQTVASGADEMGISIKEIARSTADATKIANNAVQLSQKTNETVQKLGVSSAEIGQVIKVITSIAQQTNLLALNATIEAARAGEAGKGFAVVANEVKELAKQTARATEDIGQRIQAIQQDTGSAVGAIGQITEVIGQISDIQNTIASAIEEQSVTTSEISRNLAEAAKGGTEITSNIVSVAQAAKSTTEAATQTQASAASLEQMSAQLKELVSQFRYEVSGDTGRAGSR